MKNTTQSGRSMVEMLGVLAIIGVLSVGGIAGYSKAMNKYKINKTTDQVSMLVANLRTLFSSQGNYDGLTNGAAIRFGVVPNDMFETKATYSDNASIKNAFNGAVTIKASKARDGDSSKNEAFIIVYKGLSQEACVTIATGDWGSGQASGLIGMAAGQTQEIKDENGSTSDSDPLINAIDALLVDADGGKGATKGQVTAQPGSKTSGTPISVTSAVKACDGGENSGAGYGVAWKYY